MGFWLFLLSMVLPIPLTMLGFGLRFQKRPPKSVNALYGYRTARSMQNADTWAFAHRHIGRTWTILGAVLLPLSVVPMFFVLGKEADAVGLCAAAIVFLQLIPLLLSIIPTERALKKTFDRNGMRRTPPPE